MECKDCKYHCNDTRIGLKDGVTYMMGRCTIANVCNTKSCMYIMSDKEVENMNICFNCKYWLGGGDWGLSCQKNYYHCSANGFDEACDKFERK